MSADINQLSREEALALLEKDHVSSHRNAADSLKTLDDSSELYKKVETIFNERLALKSAHAFHLDKIEVVSASRSLSTEFKRRLHKKSNICFGFHGTTESNHTSIFNQGFSLGKEHVGQTDFGYIGRGIYLSPHPEYSAAYIKGTPGIRLHTYRDPVVIGMSCKLLGCIVILGDTRRVRQMEYKTEIDKSLDSQWAWVTSNADVTTDRSEYFALEYAIREPQGVYPRFRFSLTRVTREVIWVDPEIDNDENSGYVRRLKSNSNIFVFATNSSATALAALKKKKEETYYRAITAGTGGEEFVRSIRDAGLQCRVLVFCQNVDYHSTWARNFYRTKVTRDKSEMIKFATWTN